MRDRKMDIMYVKGIILNILLMVLFADCAYAMGDSFPSKMRKSVSPDGRYAILCTLTKAPPGESDEIQWFEFRLKDISTGGDKFVQKFIRSAEVLWAPDSQHFAVTYWMGSNVSWIEVYPSKGNLVGINPYQIITAKLGAFAEVENDSHVYFEAIHWQSANILVVNLFGHMARKTAKEFCYLFEVDLTGNAKRIELDEAKKVRLKTKKGC